MTVKNVNIEKIGTLNEGVWKTRFKCCRSVLGVNGVCETITTCMGGGIQPKIIVYGKDGDRMVKG